MVSVRQVKIFPIPDKAPEARALLEEQVKSNSQNESIRHNFHLR